MKKVNFDFGRLAEKEKRKAIATQLLVKKLRRMIATGMAAGLLFLSTGQAKAFDIKALTHAIGATIATMTTGKDSSDTERALAAGAGVAAAEIISSAITGKPPTQQEMLETAGHAVAGGIGAMTGSQKDSDFERGVKAAGGIVVYEVVQGLYNKYRVNVNRAQSGRTEPYVAPGSRNPNNVSYANYNYQQPVYDDGQTACRKVLVRIVENGKLVTERIEERCEARRVQPGYLYNPTY